MHADGISLMGWHPIATIKAQSNFEVGPLAVYFSAGALVEIGHPAARQILVETAHEKTDLEIELMAHTLRAIDGDALALARLAQWEGRKLGETSAKNAERIEREIRKHMER